MMKKFVTHTGKPVVLDFANVDTDQIIPKQFLKRIERTGFGEFLFWDWRFRSNGETIADFPLNHPENAGASILITGENFGCGSSREHAPWSILEYGFRVVIGPGFADIFYNNSLKAGLLPIVLSPDLVAALMDRSRTSSDSLLTVNLAGQTVSSDDGYSVSFDIDPFRKHCLLHGLDDIGLTMAHKASISDFEARSRKDFPFLAFS